MNYERTLGSICAGIGGFDFGIPQKRRRLVMVAGLGRYPSTEFLADAGTVESLPCAVSAEPYCKRSDAWAGYTPDKYKRSNSRININSELFVAEEDGWDSMAERGREVELHGLRAGLDAANTEEAYAAGNAFPPPDGKMGCWNFKPFMMRCAFILFLIAVAATAMGQGSALLPLSPDDLSTNIAPDLQAEDCVSLALDSVPACDGLVIHFGNQSGRYMRSILFPQTNVFTISNLDVRLPWYFVATAFVSNVIPEVHCVTHGTNDFCQTNWLTESAFSNEAFWITSNALPYLSISNQTVRIVGWGKPSPISIYAGTNLSALTNLVTNFPGTNGPWIFTDQAVPGTKFYKVTRQ